MHKNFDDYLNLLEQDLSDFNLIIFSGKSGVGKSTYIKSLIERHSSLKDNDFIEISTGRPLKWPKINFKRRQHYYIDELHNLYDFFKVLQLVYYGNTVICASHLAKPLFLLTPPFCRIKFFNLNTSSKKITNYLVSNNILFSKKTVRKYINEFKASYTDLKIILETGKGESFDEDYLRFKKFYRIKLKRNYFPE